MSLIASGLGHQFPGGPPLFTDLNFSHAPGDLVAITGPSGSGKSTILALAAGWLKPTQGSISWGGSGGTHWVFQNPHGVARRTALDHVTLPILAAGGSRAAADQQARALLAEFQLAAIADRPFQQLSGGEAQRLMLARGLAARPGLLLVDEPTAQLDQHSAATVIDTLAHLAGRGAIVLVATHDPRAQAACPQQLNVVAAAQKS